VVLVSLYILIFQSKTHSQLLLASSGEQVMSE